MKTNYVVPMLNRYILGRITSGKDEDEYVKFGLYSRSMRVRLRLSRESLSVMTGIDCLKLSAIESDLLTVSDLVPDELRHLEEHLGVTYQEFLQTWYVQLTTPDPKNQDVDTGYMNHIHHAPCSKLELDVSDYVDDAMHRATSNSLINQISTVQSA